MLKPKCIVDWLTGLWLFRFIVLTSSYNRDVIDLKTI